ncbi:hypothetical protein O6H91_13G006400 [Diphasiastrum complanatum]|uniref:Uncharacterized protein n=1 Tax=Diphasiastrum complanatum TaxID=34168 RepID=A0ACC2BRS2_DIPCM|nr:hypothetical protein O6H91_13G006400 [Diphasiastrum complanatum]
MDCLHVLLSSTLLQSLPDLQRNCMQCRLAGLTYRGLLTVDVCFQWNNGPVIRHNMSCGRMPIMVKIVALKRSAFRKRGSAYTDKGVLMRCVRPDQSSVTLRVYYLQHGSATLGFMYAISQLILCQFCRLDFLLVQVGDCNSLNLEYLRSRRQEFLVPVGIILKALIETNDREIFDQLTSVHEEAHNGIKGAVGTQLIVQRAKIILDEVRTYAVFTRFQCVQFIGERFRPLLEVSESLSAVAVGEKVLKDFMFVHLDNSRDKFNLLIHILHRLFAFADGTAAVDNADALQHQELLLPGHLLNVFVKDRMQNWLSRIKTVISKEVEGNTSFDLQDLTKLLKLMEKVSLTSICKDVEYLLTTGNLSTQSTLDLQQASGFTVVAEKLNFLRFISHFRSVHRGAFFAQLRTTTVRKLLPESWGFLCPVHTPDGTPCGLLNHLTSLCQVSTDLDTRGHLKDPITIRKSITTALVGLGMIPIMPLIARLSPPEHLVVLLDGRLLGHMRSDLIPAAATHLRKLKVTGTSEVPDDLEVAYVPCTFAGAYPGLFLYTTPARFLRPVKQLESFFRSDEVLELIAPFEQAYMDIRCPDGGDTRKDIKLAVATHEEICPTAMLSVVANLTPWSDHNQSPRNMYQCQMGKQTMGFPGQAIKFRSDNKLYRLQTPQSPIAQTATYKDYHVDEFPVGTNAVVAVLAYTGYDMEDAMILNKSSMERGMCHGQIYKSETVDLTEMRQRGDGIVNVFSRSDGQAGRRTVSGMDQTSFIDRDGLPHVGQVLKNEDPFCSVLNTMTGRVKLSKLKASEMVVVDSVAVIGTGYKEPLQKVNIRMRHGRNPVIGDKFSSRHGQKGVLSQLWPDIDMPFSAVTGMRPDIIINPHAFPSRMTIGMLLESMAGKGGAVLGKFVDATPFQNVGKKEFMLEYESKKKHDFKSPCHHPESAITEFGQQLASHGFNYHGTEVMYSGVLGTELTCEIFIGIVYYQRLRHMVSDKFQVRSMGAVNPVTRQPVKGRKLGGGIRFGEMERDALLAHGAAYLLHDRLHACSDYHIADICSLCGSLLSPVPLLSDKSGSGLAFGLPLLTSKVKKSVCRVCNTSRGIERVAMPFVFRYLAAELAAMNIKLTLNVKDGH